MRQSKNNFMKKIFPVMLFCLCFGLQSKAQDSAVVQPKVTTAEEQPNAPKFTRATFNSSRVINMQSTEIVSRHALEFMISHHFSYIWNKYATGKQYLGQLFGLNSGVAHTYLSFSYSPMNWMNVGLAAAGNSVYEGWAKFRVLRQQTGKRKLPVSVS